MCWDEQVSLSIHRALSMHNPLSWWCVAGGMVGGGWHWQQAVEQQQKAAPPQPTAAEGAEGAGAEGVAAEGNEEENFTAATLLSHLTMFKGGTVL